MNTRMSILILGVEYGCVGSCVEMMWSLGRVGCELEEERDMC